MQAYHAIWEVLRAGGSWVYPILALAALAAFLAVDKTIVFWRYARLPSDILQLVETYGFAWEELEKKLSGLPAGNYFRRFFLVILENRDKPAWWVESRAADEATLIEKSLAKRLWLIETVVTAAPLIGLLGTISGMIGSFRVFGGNGQIDPSAVTGGVAEALISTALGIFVALLALFTFNYYSALLAGVLGEVERLGTRLIDHIRLDQQKP